MAETTHHQGDLTLAEGKTLSCDEVWPAEATCRAQQATWSSQFSCGSIGDGAGYGERFQCQEIRRKWILLKKSLLFFSSRALFSSWFFVQSLARKSGAFRSSTFLARQCRGKRFRSVTAAVQGRGVAPLDQRWVREDVMDLCREYPGYLRERERSKIWFKVRLQLDSPSAFNWWFISQNLIKLAQNGFWWRSVKEL